MVCMACMIVLRAARGTWDRFGVAHTGGRDRSHLHDIKTSTHSAGDPHPAGGGGPRGPDGGFAAAHVERGAAARRALPVAAALAASHPAAAVPSRGGSACGASGKEVANGTPSVTCELHSAFEAGCTNFTPPEGQPCLFVNNHSCFWNFSFHSDLLLNVGPPLQTDFLHSFYVIQVIADQQNARFTPSQDACAMQDPLPPASLHTTPHAQGVNAATPASQQVHTHKLLFQATQAANSVTAPDVAPPSQAADTGDLATPLPLRSSFQATPPPYQQQQPMAFGIQLTPEEAQRDDQARLRLELTPAAATDPVLGTAADAAVMTAGNDGNVDDLVDERLLSHFTQRVSSARRPAPALSSFGSFIALTLLTVM